MRRSYITIGLITLVVVALAAAYVARRNRSIVSTPLVIAMWEPWARARDTFADLDVAGIGRQLRSAESTGEADLADAYRQQLHGAQRCEEQLGRYYAERRRATGEVDTIRMSLAAASSMQSGEDGRQAAEALRSVREHVGALVEGMEEAYAERPAP